MTSLDPTTQAVIEQSVLSDPEFQKLVMGVAKKALLVQIDFLQHGTPEQQIAVGKSFMPIYAKVLAKEDEDVNTQVFEETRRIMSQVIRRKKKTETVETGTDNGG